MKKKHIAFVLFFIQVYLSAFVVHALMPPLSPEELNKESNKIVIAKVVEVKKTGEFIPGGCADKTGYIATLKVSKTLKGKHADSIKLHFYDYDFKEGCVGSPDRTHSKGEKGKYYLSCNEKRCRLTHWNGFERVQ